MEFVSKSDVGRKREKNEDYLITNKYDNECTIYIVADGLGGYESGEVASKVASEIILAYVEKCYMKDKRLDFKNILKESIILANDEIYKLEKTDVKYKNMGTTLVIVLIHNGNIFYTWVGDSRIYNINSSCDKIIQITEDDTYVNTLVKTNIIDETQAKNHPQKHMLTKAVGVFNKIDIDIYELDNSINGYILMCTDGVSNMLSEKDILNIFKKNKFENTAEKIVAKANDKGGSDNITLIAIKL